jgi:hypothetical protein
MPYNEKQYHAALDFLPAADENIVNADDQKRVRAYDLYEFLYINSTVTLKIVLRGDDQTPILMPSAKKLIEAQQRFLGVNLNYFVDAGGDEGTRSAVDDWWGSFFKREALASKFTSNKRWGLVRGDACFYIYSKPQKAVGDRICIKELDPRQIFEIENADDEVIGYHVVDTVQDWREEDKPDKRISRRRTFRKVFQDQDETADDYMSVVGVTSELTFWEIGKWDDRDVVNRAKMEAVTEGAEEHGAEEEFFIGSDQVSITQLPIYKWRTRPPQNSTWGHSTLTGLETLLYAVNQSLSDEDATIVFQGLGMYVTTAGPPRDPDTGEVTTWNIGPKQVIEIGQEQKFDRVTGVDSLEPFQSHMTFIDEKGLSESSGTPEIAIGRVDVAVAESGISLQLQMAPLIAGNAELELEMINVLDQMFHDITTMWLPAYEPEQFGDFETMQEITVVCLFDDPMPKNRDAEIQETVLLDSANLILKSMAVAKLRTLGWRYPETDPITGEPLDDEMIAQMLIQQSAALAAAADPFSASLAGQNLDDAGNPIDDTPTEQTIDLGQS